MAKHVITTMVDDIDGTEAAETVEFSFEGVGYEIDLSTDNATGLRDALAGYIASARKAGPARQPQTVRTPRRTPTAGSADRDYNRKVREWASDNGIGIAERGRISTVVLAAYEAGDPSAARQAQTVSASEQPAEPEAESQAVEVESDSQDNGSQDDEGSQDDGMDQFVRSPEFVSA